MERRRWGIKDVAVLLTLLLNFGGLVWAASAVSHSVATLEQTVDRLDKTVSKVIQDMIDLRIDYNARLRVLEDRARNE